MKGRKNAINESTVVVCCMLWLSGLVHIVDRHGQAVEEVLLPASHGVSVMEWDREGEVLAILQDNVGSLVLWELASRRITQYVCAHPSSVV